MRCLPFASSHNARISLRLKIGAEIPAARLYTSEAGEENHLSRLKALQPAPPPITSEGKKALRAAYASDLHASSSSYAATTSGRLRKI